MSYDKLVKALRSASTVSTAWEKLMLNAAAAIEELQAQLPKQGKWVRVEDGESYHYECSECGERPLYSRYGDVSLSGVCPMCGAKMEVQDGSC